MEYKIVIINANIYLYNNKINYIRLFIGIYMAIILIIFTSELIFLRSYDTMFYNLFI